MCFGYGGGGLFMGLAMILFWGGLIALTVWGVRAAGSGSRPHVRGSRALEILEERYATGEIDRAEFEEGRRMLDGNLMRNRNLLIGGLVALVLGITGMAWSPGGTGGWGGWIPGSMMRGGGMMHGWGDYATVAAPIPGAATVDVTAFDLDSSLRGLRSPRKRRSIFASRTTGVSSMT